MMASDEIQKLMIHDVCCQASRLWLMGAILIPSGVMVFREDPFDGQK